MTKRNLTRQAEFQRTFRDAFDASPLAAEWRDMLAAVARGETLTTDALAAWGFDDAAQAARLAAVLARRKEGAS